MEITTEEPLNILSQLFIPIILVLISGIVSVIITKYSKIRDKNQYIKFLRTNFPIIEKYFLSIKIYKILRALGIAVFLWSTIAGIIFESIIKNPLLNILLYILDIEFIKKSFSTVISNLVGLDVILFLSSYLIIVSSLLICLIWIGWCQLFISMKVEVPKITEYSMIKVSTQIFYLSIWFFLGIIIGINITIHYTVIYILQNVFLFNWTGFADAYTYLATNTSYFTYYLLAYILGIVFYFMYTFVLYQLLTEFSEEIIKLITSFYKHDFPEVKITTENGDAKGKLTDIRDKTLVTLSEKTMITMIPWDKIEMMEANKKNLKK